MVQGKKDTSNGGAKYQQSNMSLPRKDMGDARGASSGKSDSRQNGNGSFRTDSAISSGRVQGERQLQRFVFDAPASTDGALESTSSGGVWDQFAENEKRFGLKTTYDENLYTTAIDKNSAQYKHRAAQADKIAREIEHNVATNSHVKEERMMDWADERNDKNGLDEEDKYSGVRRQQDFPPLSSSGSNKYTPPARRAPTGQATVSGAPVDPAIISSQLARPDRSAAEKPKVEPKVAAEKPKAIKHDVSTPPATAESSFTTPEPKAAVANAPASASRAQSTASPRSKAEGTPNATATVERDVTNAFKGFAAQQRKQVDQARSSRARNDKEIKLNDLKKFAATFALNTPVPSDLVSIIAKDPAKQKEIQEKAQRNAEKHKANPSEGAKPSPALTEAKAASRPGPAAQGASPLNVASRQVPPRTQQFNSQYKPPTHGVPQSIPPQQNRAPGNLGARLRNLEQNKHNQTGPAQGPANEARLPPTGPASGVDPNFSRRSSGVTSAQGARLNPNSSEFRPSPHAATFNPTGNPSSGSSPRSAVNAVAPAPISRSLLRRKPIPEAERPPMHNKFDALEHIKTLKSASGKEWKHNGIKPAYDTQPVWRQASTEEKEGTMAMTYTKMFEMAPFPSQPMSPSNPPHAIPQVPHQHQLPFHLQQGSHNMAVRGSPRQVPMNMHGNQHPHGPAPPFNGHDDHRMMPSHSAQSFQSPRLQNVPLQYPSPMNQSAQMYNPQMMPYGPGAPPMQPYRSLSQNHQFMPQQGPMGPIMMQNPGPTFLTSQGMAPGPQMMYPQGGQGPFMPPGGGHPPQMPVANGFPSPGRSAAPMMMSQGSQQGHQQPQMFGMSPGMSPGPQYGAMAPVYAQQPPGQMPMRGTYGGPQPFGTSPQIHPPFNPQQSRNHQNGSYNNNNNNKSFQPHAGQHQSGPNNHIPTGPQARASEGTEEAK